MMIYLLTEAILLQKMIRESVVLYRQRILNELDNLGFMVVYQSGRYRINPAFVSKKNLEGFYYFGQEDLRPENRFFTISKDHTGVQLDLEQFEYLINKQDVREHELQAFFEENPHFLNPIAQAMPQVQLKDPDGSLLIPDFILKPLSGIKRDLRWEVLDLKLPQNKLIVGPKKRKRFSHEVIKAIRQLRSYGDYFQDLRNSSYVEKVLGHNLRRPKLGVLIGNAATVEPEHLDKEQSRVADVKIVTYDEILEDQKRLAERLLP